MAPTPLEVFGDPAWRTPSAIAQLEPGLEGVVVVLDGGGALTFSADGLPRPVERPAPPVAVVATPKGSLRVEVAGQPGPTLAHSRGYGEARLVGDWVTASLDDRAVGIWRLDTGERHRVFALGSGGAAALSPDHLHLAAGGFSADAGFETDVYRVHDGARVATVTTACSPSALAISADSALLAVVCDEEVELVKLATGQRVAEVPGPRAYVRAAAFSPDGGTLWLGGNDHALHALTAPDWGPKVTLRGSRGDVREVSAAGGLVVSHSWGDASAWSWSPGAAPLELGGPGREVMAVATDGDVVLLGVTYTDRGRRAGLERWRGGERVADAGLRGPLAAPLVRAVGPLRGGGAWYTASGQLVYLDADLRRTWASPEPEDPTADGDAAASADGGTVALVADGWLTVWDAAGRPLGRAETDGCGDRRPAVSADGARVAVVDGRAVTVFDAATGARVASLAHGAEAREAAVAWAADGRVVAAVDGRLVVWRPGAATFAEVPAPGALSVAVSGGDVYVGRTDGTVLRRALDPWLAEGASRPARASGGRCARTDAEVGMMSTLGLFGEERPRGRLDDALPHE